MFGAMSFRITCWSWHESSWPRHRKPDFRNFHPLQGVVRLKTETTPGLLPFFNILVQEHTAQPMDLHAAAVRFLNIRGFWMETS